MQIQSPEQNSLLIIIRFKSERIWSNQMMARNSKKLMIRPTVKHNQGPGRDYNADNEVFLTKVM
jgi:hypothetical protein